MAHIFRKLTQFSKGEIDRAFASAKRVVKHPGLTLLSAPKQGDFARILIVVSRKVGTAPQRNKLRRQIKTIFFEDKMFEGERDLIALLRAPATELTFDELKKLLLKATSVGKAS